MSTTVKKKIRLGTLFLFSLVLVSCGICIFHLVRLKNDADRILKNNYESLDYAHTMQRLLDDEMTSSTRLTTFDSLLSLQEKNITEAGEKEITAAIRTAFEEYRKEDIVKAPKLIRTGIQQLLSLNMKAIEQKNKKARDTADNALTYISLLAVLVFLIGLTFSINFPSILTSPINALTEGIQQIAKKNYHHRIHLERKDEFGQMADAFNDMAERLEYFESSNLNKIIFEKTRAEAVINSLREASIGIDKNDTILFANDQALQLLGMQARDLVSKSVPEVSRKNDLFRYLVEEKGSVPFKIVVDNRENYFTKETIDISQEGTSSKVIILRNITSFKELDVAKTNFIATISHELKTPLASSDISLKLLEDERVSHLSAGQKDLIANLKQDNQRMLRILSELLNMSQIEAGKIQLDISEVNPFAIAEGAIGSVMNTARGKGISLIKKFDRDMGLVRADAEKTVWVLNNFLTNAIKYSPEAGSIEIQVNKEASEIRFSVTDHGPGIPSEHLSRVFERFFKVPGSRAGGTGLGLAISKEFIEAQGGHIWVKSEMGAGSTFGFNLPGK